jgi:S-formylglutathione hydrolase FrmB
VFGIAFLALAAAALASASGARAQQLVDASGVHVLTQTQLDSRLVALRVSSGALPKPANVRILLPSGYAAHAHRHYPVLYLLHGTSGGAADWTTMGDAEATTAGRPLIVVMPDIALGDDGGGWCTNWPKGTYRWETFHIDQLIPWVDHNLRTVAGRAGRAIAGLSQGGFCSMSYAARHPDLFMTALSFSGAPDIAYDLEAQLLVTPIINATELALDHVAVNSMFRSRLTNEINWAAHDPTTLANNLRGMNLLMYAGNGVPGPLDSGLNAGASAIEAGVGRLTRLFHARLDALRIASYYDDYGPGTHVWPYWTRDLRQSIGPVMADFARGLVAPRKVAYTSAAPSYAVFGWQVTVHRLVEEFSTLSSADASGFTVSGSGSATVLTPPTYRRGARYALTLQSRAGRTKLVEHAEADRRLRVTVPLGPSNTVQQYAIAGTTLGTTVYTTRVAIALAR